MTEKRYQMRNTNLADETGRTYYNIRRNDGVNICQVYGKNNAKSLIDELNELHDEIDFFKFALDSNRELTMEVEQEQCRLYKKLEKENKELKQFKEQLFDIIDERIKYHRKYSTLTVRIPMDCKYRKECLENHSVNVCNKAKENAYKELKKELGE